MADDEYAVYLGMECDDFISIVVSLGLLGFRRAVISADGLGDALVLVLLQLATQLNLDLRWRPGSYDRTQQHTCQRQRLRGSLLATLKPHYAQHNVNPRPCMAVAQSSPKGTQGLVTVCDSSQRRISSPRGTR